MAGPLLLKQLVVSNVELSFYVIGFVSTASYLFFSAYQATRRKDFKNFTRLDALGIPVDKTCFLCNTYITLMRKLLWPVMLYVVLSKAIRTRVPVLVWSVTCGLFGVALNLYVFKLKGFLILLAIVGFNLTVALLRSRIAMWISHMLFLYFLCSLTFRRYYYTELPPDLRPFMSCVITYMAVRCLSFFDDVFRNRDSIPLMSKENLCTFLHFLFYPPVVFGPIVIYSRFKKSLYAPVQTTYLYLAFRAFRLVLWAGLLHVSLYIHYSAYLTKFNLAEKEDEVAFLGCLYLNGIRFYLIHLQIFGWPNVLGHLDGFDMPEWPRCISHIYSYVDMWKYFDRGLYEFMKSHIYIPLGGSRNATTKFSGTILCFLYVAFFHDLSFRVRIWILMNFVQIICEISFINFYYYSDYAKPLHSLSPAWARRLFAFLGAWTFMFSSIGFFFFNIGYRQISNLISVCGTPSFWLSFFIFGYFMVQLAIECSVRGIDKERSTPPCRNEIETEKKKDL